jgi:hypothetical protein
MTEIKRKQIIREELLRTFFVRQDINPLLKRTGRPYTL